MNSSKKDVNKDKFQTTLKEIIAEFAGDNPKLSALLAQVVDKMEKDKKIIFEQDIYVIINQMRYAAIDDEIRKYAKKWYLGFEDVKYEAFNFRNGKLANENKLKDNADYAAYKEEHKNAMTKVKFRKKMIDELKTVLMPEITPLM